MKNTRECEYNVMSHLGNMSQDEIVDYVQKNCIKGTAVCMMQIQRDINFGCIVRSCNALGIEHVFYYGANRKWDRRSAVGTYKYTSVTHIPDLDALHAVMANYHTVALEQHPESVSLYEYKWPKNPMIMIGEENIGLPDDLIEKCDSSIYIPQRGSVRSMNAAVAASITIWDFCSKTV